MHKERILLKRLFYFFVVHKRENMHEFGEKGIRVKTNCVPGKRAEMDISYENLKNTECRKKAGTASATDFPRVLHWR